MIVVPVPAIFTDDETGDHVLAGQPRSFADAGLMTTNDGLVVRLRNGAEYQVKPMRARS